MVCCGIRVQYCGNLLAVCVVYFVFLLTWLAFRVGTDVYGVRALVIGRLSRAFASRLHIAECVCMYGPRLARTAFVFFSLARCKITVQNRT